VGRRVARPETSGGEEQKGWEVRVLLEGKGCGERGRMGGMRGRGGQF